MFDETKQLTNLIVFFSDLREKKLNLAKNDKGENYYVIETREVDRNLFDAIAKFYENIFMCCLFFFQRKKTP